MRNPGRRQKPFTEINTAPFTDIILVLMAIFMVTTPLVMQSNIQVSLPGSKTGQPHKDARQISVSITSEGLIYLDNKIVSKKMLKTKIVKLHQDNPELGVVLLSDKMVRFKDIVGLLDVFNELEIKNLNIATKTE